MEKQPEATVRGLLAGARLTVSEEELDRLVRVYPVLRTQIDALYEIDLDADEPALGFDPDPPAVSRSEASLLQLPKRAENR